MDFVLRKDIKKIDAPSRVIQRAFGFDATVYVDNANMGFARFEAALGKMPAHVHEDEIIYVLEAKNAVVTYGKSENEMTQKRQLGTGDLIRFHEGEWHVFDFTSEDGFMDILFFFSQDKINVINAQQ